MEKLWSSSTSPDVTVAAPAPWDVSHSRKIFLWIFGPSGIKHHQPGELWSVLQGSIPQDPRFSWLSWMIQVGNGGFSFPAGAFGAGMAEGSRNRTVWIPRENPCAWDGSAISRICTWWIFGNTEVLSGEEFLCRGGEGGMRLNPP